MASVKTPFLKSARVLNIVLVVLALALPSLASASPLQSGAEQTTDAANVVQTYSQEELGGADLLAPSSSGYIWPLVIAGRISQSYSSSHSAIDIAASAGTEVVASMSGTVKYVQRWDGHSTTNMQSYGNLVIVYHPSNNTSTYYAHMRSIAVSKGQSVSQGQKLGEVGTTGNSTGNHLHFELRTNSGPSGYGGSDGRKANPLSYVSSSNIGAHTHSYGNFTYTPSSSGSHVKTGTCSCGATTSVTEGCSYKWISGERYACAYCGAEFSGSKPFGTVTSVPNGTYVISSTGNSNLCLDVIGGSKDNGTRLQLYPKNGSNAQSFRLTRNSDGTYAIANVGSGKVVEIAGSNVFRGGTIQQWDDAGIATQRWYLESNSDGTFSFRNANSNMYLDVINGVFAQNTLLHSYPRNGSYAQSFYLEGAGNSLGIPGSNLRMTGVSSSYEYTGSSITPKPTLERHVYSGYAITVPESGAGSEYTAYSHVRTISVKAGRTYAVEVGSIQNLSNNPTTPTLRVYDFDAETTVSDWVSFSISGSSQRKTITPTGDGILLFYANYPGSGAYCAARYNEVRVYEVLREGTDYALSYANNVQPGRATLTASGRNGYSGSVSRSFEIDAPSTPSFSDVDPTSWYATGGFVDYVVSNGLMSGYKDASGSSSGRFGPDDTVSRGQMATIIYRYANPGSSATTDPSHYATSSGVFSDLPSVAYYNAAIEWCYEQGIITGYRDASGAQTGRFGPDDPITREQMATIAHRLAQWEGSSTSMGSTSGFDGAPDRTQVSEFAVEPMAWCYDRGIITGDATTGRLNPASPTTRAQAAKIITVLLRDVL